MPYKLNNILLETYGIIPGRMPGETLAVKGIFDLPKRLGDTHYSWAETNGVQAFVDADEIFMDGRTITFQGILIGDLATLKTFLNTFKTAIDGFNNVVPFETPYGTFCVLVKKVTPTFYNGGALVQIEFYEPEVGASCSIGGTPTVYESEAYSEDATKNNCASGYYGSTETLTAAAGKFTSTISQAAANLLAVQWVRDYKQDYANATGTCTINPTVYYNAKLIGTLQKDDCAVDLIGSEVSYEVPAYKYSSLISQIDADDQAQAELDATLTQAYANANGTCILYFYNEVLVFTRQKDDCGAGYVGSVESITVPAGTYSSTLSQADADNIALAFAQLDLSQAVANAQGTCEIPEPNKVTLIFDQTNFSQLTKSWRIESITNIGGRFIFIAYGVSVVYTVLSGDTPSSVAIGLAALINATTTTQWNAMNAYPLNATSSHKPEAKNSASIIIVQIYRGNTINLYAE